jgi:two-component system NarL family sensor kinase
MKMYFIVMELLNNVIKHSGAENTTLSLQEVEDQLLIHVWDNGVGFDTSEYKTIESFGLNQIYARINNMKGELVVQSKLNSGTSIHIKVPILHMA